MNARELIGPPGPGYDVTLESSQGPSREGKGNTWQRGQEGKKSVVFMKTLIA